MAATFELRKVWEGRMGNNLTTSWEVWINGEIVGGDKRKWLACAVGEAIVSGKIEAAGDTTSRFADWAYTNAPAVFDRMIAVGA